MRASRRGRFLLLVGLLRDIARKMALALEHVSTLGTQVSSHLSAPDYNMCAHAMALTIRGKVHQNKILYLHKLPGDAHAMSCFFFFLR